MNKEVSDNEIEIENYSFIRKDRDQKTGKKWGGVLIYFESRINIHEINYDFELRTTEAILIEAELRSQKLLLACIYRPPNDKHFIKTFEAIVEKVCHRRNVLLLGDLNIDLSRDKSSPLAVQLRRILYTQNLTNVIKDPTRINNKSSTLIDHAITSNPAKVTNSGSFDTCISDHNLIFVVFKLFQKHKPPKLITVRNYKNVNTNKLQQDLENSPWQLIDLFDDPNDSLWCWETMFKKCTCQSCEGKESQSTL